MPAEHFDVVVIGGGPNGLTAAAYLSRAGASVVTLDKRFEWGGTMATDDYSTPFFYNLCQYELPLGAELPPFSDLQLDRQGLRLLSPDPVVAFVPAGGGDSLVVFRDGSGLGAIGEHLAALNAGLPPLLYLPPLPEQQLEEMLARNPETKPAVDFARFTPAALAEELREPRAAALARYLCGRLGFVDDDQPFGLMGAVAFACQLRPSVAYGGAKALADSLFRAAAGSGVQFRAVADVVRIERRGDAFGIGCRDGREFEAASVVCTLDPQSTFLELLDDGLVPDGLRQAAAGWRQDPVGPFTAHFGIKGEPPRTGSPEATEALIQVLGFEDSDAVVAHQRTTADGRLPPQPAGHLTVTTRHDRTQAAPGPFGPLHTLRFQSPAPHAHPEADWDHRRADYRTRCWELISQHTEGASDARLLFAFADAPADIQRRFRTTRAGTPRQGALLKEQTFIQRPHPDASDCRTPIEGFYLGGGAVHPGIPGSLAGGYRAARAVCEDREFERWWPEPAIVSQARETGVLPETFAKA